jgi:hypothetical protein
LSGYRPAYGGIGTTTGPVRTFSPSPARPGLPAPHPVAPHIGGAHR